MAPITTDRHRDSTTAAQREWLRVEYVHRSAFALLRLNALSEIADSLLADDLFDAAYAIWDDFIDGRRADERFPSHLEPTELTEHAMIFAEVAKYLTARDIVTLARAAWGMQTFETHLADTTESKVIGKFAWYPGSAAVCIRVVARACPGHVHLGREVIITPAGESVTALTKPEHVVALHPAFGGRR